MSERRRVTLLYDKDCGFCRWSANAIRRWDGRDSLAFASIQSERGTRLLHAMRPELRLDSMHVVTADGRIWSGGEAVRVISSKLPGGRILAFLAGISPDLTESLYRVVVRHRERLGRWLGQDACNVDPMEGGSGKG